MDACAHSRVLSGLHTSTSRLVARRMSYFVGAGMGSASTQHRSSSAMCRSVFESSDGSRTCRFPTVSITGQDWRAFRAHLVAWERSERHAEVQSSDLKRPPYPPLVSGNSWAHPLVGPERGCLLLSKRDNMLMFTDSVVLITKHEAAGSVGFMLNKPSPMKVEDMHVIDCPPGFKEAFGSQHVLVGGPMLQSHVTLLHRFQGISRHKIADGMHMGGLDEAIRLVRAGLVRPSDFTLVVGMSQWGPGQLQAEIAHGWWHVISASPDLVLPTPSAPPSPQPASAAAPCVSSRTSAPAHAQQDGARHPHASNHLDAHEEDEEEEAEGQHPRAHRQRCQPNSDGACGGPVRPATRGSASRRVQSPMYRRIARLAVRGA